MVLHHQENKERQPRPHELLVKWSLRSLGRCDLGQQGSEGFYEVEESETAHAGGGAATRTSTLEKDR